MQVIRKTLLSLLLMGAGFYASFHVGDGEAVLAAIAFSVSAGLAAAWRGGRELAARPTASAVAVYTLVLLAVALFIYLGAASVSQNFAFRK